MSVMNDTTLLLVRHPETEANVSGRFVGQGESPYTSLGRLQARRLVHKIARFGPDDVTSSPLLRAMFVATRASSLSGVPLIVDPRFIEIDFGQAHGMTWQEISDAGIPFNYKSASQPVAPGGESRDQLRGRVGYATDQLVARGGRHVVVAHAGVMRAVLSHLLGLSADGLWMFHIHTAQMAVVRVVDGHAQLEEYVAG